MKIKRGENYFVELYEEPNALTDHRRTYLGKLEFTGVELVEAIVSAGMPDVYLTKSEKRNRKAEIYFKINLFETYVVSSADGKLSFDSAKKKYLDSTEVGAINYWIGMILITVLGRKKYDYDFMVHLSMVELFSKKMRLNKRAYISTSGKKTYKSPDLLAINCSKKKYGVFESKGYSSYNKQAMERGYEQAKSIKKVNGKSPDNCLVVMSKIGTKGIQMIEKDPEGEDIELNIDLLFVHLYHFLPIVELITELNPVECEGGMRGTLELGGESYLISVPMKLYEKLSPILLSENKSSVITFLEEEIFEEESCEEESCEEEELDRDLYEEKIIGRDLYEKDLSEKNDLSNRSKKKTREWIYYVE